MSLEGGCEAALSLLALCSAPIASAESLGHGGLLFRFLFTAAKELRRCATQRLRVFLSSLRDFVLLYLLTPDLRPGLGYAAALRLRLVVVLRGSWRWGLV